MGTPPPPNRLAPTSNQRDADHTYFWVPLCMKHRVSGLDLNGFQGFLASFRGSLGFLSGSLVSRNPLPWTTPDEGLSEVSLAFLQFVGVPEGFLKSLPPPPPPRLGRPLRDSSVRYLSLAASLGRCLARRKLTLVFGGGKARTLDLVVPWPGFGAWFSR